VELHRNIIDQKSCTADCRRLIIAYPFNVLYLFLSPIKEIEKDM